ncbi:dihydroorotate dehydrogenase (quinone), mitochondrial isoform X2 [Sitophilus oryzae]|nr:dihydroorotate dehydrogenase (quinone), mitochondrial isoform X2 [Sitophilus oryzae]XP_030753110.1 dihydroorotate dehydrogenase (quinone), mitochondrial isoform X2 [Sitophilus oryzae]
MKSLFYVTVGAIGAFSGICIYKGDEKFYKNFVMPVIHLLDPEQAHKLAVITSQYRLTPVSKYKDPNTLSTTVFNKTFANPIGIAAGFDKDGKAVMGLKDIGFGFIEVGSVTPLPQPGNEKPRVFRLSNDRAIINRYGFNSEGHTVVFERLKDAKTHLDSPVIIGVNLGKNKTSDDSISDYVKGINTFGSISDYLVINISSPNTPNLRSLQNKESLRQLLKAVILTRNNLEVSPKPPLLLKLAPDLTHNQRRDIADVIKQPDCKVDGLIICNTTIERPQLKSEHKNETGGLSGEPLKDVSTNMILEMSQLTNGIPIIGVGGVASGRDAYEKIKAGASLVQLYSSIVFEGPPVVTKIKKELSKLLEEDGYKNISEAVGVNVKSI